MKTWHLRWFVSCFLLALLAMFHYLSSAPTFRGEMGPHYEVASKFINPGIFARQKLVGNCYKSGRFGQGAEANKRCEEFVPPPPADGKQMHDNYLKEARERVNRELLEKRSALWNRMLTFWGAGCVLLFFLIWRFDRAGYY